jgi:hypothetical protein
MPYRLLAVIFLLLDTPVAARQESAMSTDYPTVIALEQMTVPLADRIALARQFKGAGNMPAPPTSVQVRQVGDRERFWVSDSSANREFQITAILRVVGQHIYFWVEEGVVIEARELQKLTDAFDERIYPTVRELWGSEANPGSDGDPRIYGLFARGLGLGTVAYFMSRHTYPAEIIPTSNQHEMLFFNLDTISMQYLGSPLLASIVAHEFQHMIRANIQDNDSTWMNEGFSTFTELLLYGSADSVPAFLNRPQTQLNTWSENEAARAANYGAATLWITYFYERFGGEALRRLSEDPGTGLDAFDHVLRQLHQPDVNRLFADWVLANFLFAPELADGRYGYELLPRRSFDSPPVSGYLFEYPLAERISSNQYATHYFMASNLRDKTTLTISLDAPHDAALLPTQATSGKWMWYSNLGDQSDMRLTRAFDLTDVNSATLEFNIWFDIEDFWDWGYVAISVDDGATWKTLHGLHTLNNDPLNTAYGPGYTGESGGWLKERISLDEYTGKSILLRFEMITDDAVTRPGMAIDDVRIPEIGYSSDVEQEADGWQSAGWIRTDNLLPQPIWVQLLQVKDGQVEVTRRLFPDEGSGLSVILETGVDDALIAISPFAPVTTQPVTFDLNVDASSSPLVSLPSGQTGCSMDCALNAAALPDRLTARLGAAG